MKTALAYMVLLLGIFFLLGCSRRAEPTSEDKPVEPATIQPAVEGIKEPEPAQIEQAEDIKMPAVCIREGSWFYSSPGDGAISRLSAGEPLVYLGQKENSTKEGRESWVYAQVERSDGSVGWTLSDYLAENTMPGVILQDAALYSQPSAANLMPNEKIFARQIVAVVEAKEFGSYYSVRWNVPDTFIIKQHYVRRVFVSLNDEDVAVARLLHIAANETNAQSQEQQLRMIISEFPESAFLPDVEKALKYALSGGEADN